MPDTNQHHERYDAVVLGSGHVGEPLAIELARAGLNTALVEGAGHADACACCGPSNAMLASANVARLARRAVHLGVGTGSVEVNFAKVQMRRLAVLDGLRTQALQALQDTPHLTLLKGEASFESAHSLLVREGTTAFAVQAKRVFINTGTRPALPDVEGLAGVSYLTSSTAMNLEKLPSDLLVLGGSYLGVELAQMFRRLGSSVSIIERHSQLLPREDRDIAAAVAENIREDGVEVFLETEAIGVADGSGGGVRLKARTPFGERVLAGSQLLVVVGHEPNTKGLNLAAAGIAVDASGYVQVNERLETSVPGVYALGVVKGSPAFAHVDYDDFRVIRANVLENSQTTTTRLTCPYTAFLDPQLGRIGLTETQAREQGRNVRVVKLPMNRVARALEMNESGGLIKVVVDGSTGRIIGAAVLGVDSREIIAILQVAMMADIPYTSLRDGLSAHPTLVGSLDTLFAALHD